MPRRDKSRPGRAARLAAIKADIAKRIRQRDLSVIAVAVQQGVTARYVQVLFRSEGTTFSKFVLEQRLARAHGLLLDPRTSAKTIRAIALDAGFADVSYFNRAFRRHYGASPSGVREAARTSLTLRPARRKAGGSKTPPTSF